MQKRVIILVNAGAGTDEKNEEFRRILESGFKNLDGADVRFLKGSEIAEAIKQAVSENPGIIVAGGGDGTINAVASRVLKTGIALGVLPLGTLNHFAKDAGIPLNLDDAIRNIIEGQVTLVDVAEVNGRIFLNNSGIGIYPGIVAEREKVQSRGHSKWMAFSLAFFAVLKKYPMVRVHIETDEKTIRQTTPFVFIGNNLYAMEGFTMGGRERLDAGNLSLFLIHRTGKTGLMRLALKALFGMIRQDRDFDAFVLNNVTIESDKNVLKVSTDGEVNAMKTPLHYRILPKALPVILPADNFKNRM